MLSGYIDESYNKDFFVLSCLTAHGGEWLWISWDWEKRIDRWNARLERQGRPTLTRYHASDCSNLKNDFDGWSPEEQRELTSDLVAALRGHPLDTFAFGIDMNEFHNVFPEAETDAKPDVTAFIYGMMTKFLIFNLGARYCMDDPGTSISLIHDRCPYDSVMLDAFKQALDDPNFEHRSCFTTMEPMSWRNCIPLQPADMLAYENFKDALRILFPRRRRKSLELLIDLETFGGGIKFLNRDALLHLENWLNGAKRLEATKSKEAAEFRRLDSLVRKTLSVPHEELKRGKFNWKKRRKAKKRGLMQKELDPKTTTRSEDWEGNNAAFTCPLCGKVFIVSGRIHRGKRKCPDCGESTGVVVGGKKTGGRASISWPSGAELPRGPHA